MYYYEILIANKNINEYYTYKNETKIEKYTIVLIEFGKNKHLGIIINIIEKKEFNFEVKNIIQNLNIKLSYIFLKWCFLIAKYYFWNIGVIAQLILPSYLIKNFYPLVLEKNNAPVHLLDLNLKQRKQIKNLKIYKNLLNEKKIWNFSNIQEEIINQIVNLKNIGFLEGQTGSGKTIIALESVFRILKNEKCKILIIVPNISLKQYWKNLIEERTGKIAFVYNNELSEIYKNSIYRWALSNEDGILIGTRSSLFLPFNNLKYIFVDEEQVHSLKQDNFPVYNTKELLKILFNLTKIPILLISATPSLESYYNIQNKKYNYFYLPNYQTKKESEIILVKKYNQILTLKTIELIKESLKKNNQILIFANRKGFAPYCICKKCLKCIECPNCLKPMIIYKNFKLLCHVCYFQKFLKKICDNCKEETQWKFKGNGIEKIFDYCSKIFSDSKIIEISSETKNLNEQLKKIENKEFQIIIGTQILAQGHDFKNIELVVILDADLGLLSPDFQIDETIFQLWKQIEGRSGRNFEINSKIILQYNNDENKFIKLFKSQNPYKIMLEERKKYNLPPFIKLTSIILQHEKKEILEKKIIIFETLIQNKCNLIGPLYLGIFNKIHKFEFLIKNSELICNLFEKNIFDNLKPVQLIINYLN